jgi:hypothetical protein
VKVVATMVAIATPTAAPICCAATAAPICCAAPDGPCRPPPS